MQSVSSSIWTRVAVSISYDDNHYTTGTSSLLLCVVMILHVYVDESAIDYTTLLLTSLGLKCDMNSVSRQTCFRLHRMIDDELICKMIFDQLRQYKQKKKSVLLLYTISLLDWLHLDYT